MTDTAPPWGKELIGRRHESRNLNPTKVQLEKLSPITTYATGAVFSEPSDLPRAAKQGASYTSFN